MRRYVTGVLCVLVFSSAAHADDREETLYASAASTDSLRWQQTSLTMTADDYARRVDKNRKIIRQGLRNYAATLRSRDGALAPAIGLVGAVVAVAAKDRRYSLNDSRSMNMVLRDTISSDRSLMLEYRTVW